MARFFLFSLIVVNLIFSLHAADETIENFDLSGLIEEENDELLRFPRGVSGGPQHLSRLPVKKPTHPETEPTQKLPPFLGGIQIPGVKVDRGQASRRNYSVLPALDNFILTSPEGKHYKFYYQLIEKPQAGGSPGEAKIIISPKPIARIAGR